MATQTAAETALMTADDLLAMGGEAKLHELVAGLLVDRPMSSFESSAVGATIATAVGTFVYSRQLGRIAGADGAYILKQDPDTVRVADVSFVRMDRLPPVEAWNHFLALAPDLAVEVISPWDTASGVFEKVREYLDAGVRLVWVVHPEQRMVTVFTPDHTARLLYEDDTLDGGDVLPGFSIAVADIFA